GTRRRARARRDRADRPARPLAGAANGDRRAAPAGTPASRPRTLRALVAVALSRAGGAHRSGSVVGARPERLRVLGPAHVQDLRPALRTARSARLRDLRAHE